MGGPTTCQLNEPCLITRQSFHTLNPTLNMLKVFGQQDIVRSNSKFESLSTKPKFKLIFFVETADTWKLALITNHET